MNGQRDVASSHNFSSNLRALATLAVAVAIAIATALAISVAKSVTLSVAVSTFWLGGQTKFGIIYIHTQLNTTFYLGITTTKTKNRQKNNLPKPATHAPSRSPPQHHRSNITILTTNIDHR